MEELWSSIVNEPLPVLGLTIGNEPREETIDTTTRKGEKPKLAETKTGANNEMKTPILYFGDDTNSDLEEEITAMEDKLKLKGNKAINQQQIIITPIKIKFVVPTTAKIFLLRNNFQNSLNIIKMTDNKVEVQSTKDKTKQKHWENCPKERWCYVKLHGQNTTIWVITAYRVINNPSGGTEATYHQQL
eukprot:8407234-Ditylum_brightwellii.AAC.1